jgi:hypothetical protein
MSPITLSKMTAPRVADERYLPDELKNAEPFMVHPDDTITGDNIKSGRKVAGNWDGWMTARYEIGNKNYADQLKYRQLGQRFPPQSEDEGDESDEDHEDGGASVGGSEAGDESSHDEADKEGGASVASSDAGDKFNHDQATDNPNHDQVADEPDHDEVVAKPDHVEATDEADHNEATDEADHDEVTDESDNDEADDESESEDADDELDLDDEVSIYDDDDCSLSDDDEFEGDMDSRFDHEPTIKVSPNFFSCSAITNLMAASWSSYPWLG